jgi:hypothetical protein
MCGFVVVAGGRDDDEVSVDGVPEPPQPDAASAIRRARTAPNLIPPDSRKPPTILGT